MESIVYKATECFNNQDIDGMAKYWHDDITIYDLESNEVVCKGVEDVYEMDKPLCLDPGRRIVIKNMVVRGNFEVAYKRFSHKEDINIVICEIENGLIKNVWGANFNAESFQK